MCDVGVGFFVVFDFDYWGFFGLVWIGFGVMLFD